jgi:molecular chaperone GrpE (heat shock protein)
VSSAHASPPDNGADPAALAAELAALRVAMDRLATATERETERAAHRESVIDRLHDENQMLRRGEVQAMLDPVRTALYRLHDMVRRESARWAEPRPPEAAHAGPLLSAIADEIAEALARTGAERFSVRPGELFDPARHRPVGTARVADPALDGTVVTAQSDGFSQGEQVIRRAEVVIGQVAGSRQPADRALDHRPRQNASAESF